MLRGERDAAEKPRTERATVVTVWGPAGSPGRTTVAVGIAAEIAAAGFSVVLGDVDTHSASVAPVLGLMDEAPGFAAACRLAGAGGLTRSELERIGQRYGGTAGFWVLTGIGQPSRWPELSADRVRQTIDECRAWADYVVLDTGSSLENDEEIASDLFSPRRNAATLTAIREADHIVAVGAADPVGLSRFLRAHGDLADIAVTDTVTVVANKVRGSAIGLNPSGQVAQALSRFGGIESPVLVPWDQQSVDAAVLAGRTLVEEAPKSAVRVALQRLVADRLLPATASRRRSVAGSRRWRR
nr:regulator [Conyzicola lurida]